MYEEEEMIKCLIDVRDALEDIYTGLDDGKYDLDDYMGIVEGTYQMTNTLLIRLGYKND